MIEEQDEEDNDNEVRKAFEEKTVTMTITPVGLTALIEETEEESANDWTYHLKNKGIDYLRALNMRPYFLS